MRRYPILAQIGSAAMRPRLWIAVLAVMFVSSRLLWLDQDPPPWGTVNYQPIDEGSYSIMAMHLLIYGRLNLEENKPGISVSTPPHVRANLFGNALSYFTLRLLGRNYYGYRATSAIWSTGVIALVLLCLREMLKACEHNRSAGIEFLLLMAIATTDFAFLVSGRVVEPSIVRAFFNVLALFLFIRLRDHARFRFFMLGFVVNISIFLVYITNVFMYFGCASAILAIIFKRGRDPESSRRFP